MFAGGDGSEADFCDGSKSKVCPYSIQGQIDLGVPIFPMNLTVLIHFFAVGLDVFMHVRVSAFSPFAQCGNGFGQYRKCSSKIGSVSESGDLLVDLSSQPSVTIDGGGSYTGAAFSGSVTVTLGNPLP
jgi:hypothetical protein